MTLDTLCKIMNFVMGMLATYLLQIGWARYRAWRTKSDKPVAPVTFKLPRRATVWLGTVLIILGSVFVGVQSVRTDAAVRALTMQTQQCYREFAEALSARSQIGLENDTLGRQQIEALASTQTGLYKFLTALITPPPDIATLPTTDQRRKDWSLGVTLQFNEILGSSNAIIGASLDRQAQLDIDREQHPYPEPNCGK